MKTVILSTLAILGAAGAAFAVRLVNEGKKSRSMPPPPLGADGGALKPCGPRPNCDLRPSAYRFEGPMTDAHQRVISVFTELGLVVTEQRDDYVRAEAKTGLFGFVDDVEALFDGASSSVTFRSQSRVGYSDLGANAKRIDSILARLARPGA